jgi:hypothetical protein
VAVDDMGALLEDLMVLVWCIPGKHGRSGGDENGSRKCHDHCLHLSSSLV